MKVFVFALFSLSFSQISLAHVSCKSNDGLVNLDIINKDDSKALVVLQSQNEHKLLTGSVTSEHSYLYESHTYNLIDSDKKQYDLSLVSKKLIGRGGCTRASCDETNSTGALGYRAKLSSANERIDLNCYAQF